MTLALPTYTCRLKNQKHVYLMKPILHTYVVCLPYVLKCLSGFSCSAIFSNY